MEEALKDQAGPSHEPIQQSSAFFGMVAATGEAADTLIAETIQCVRNYPLSAVAAAFGGGLLAGWLIAHNLKPRFHAGGEESQRASETKAGKRAISIWENEGGAYRG